MSNKQTLSLCRALLLAIICCGFLLASPSQAASSHDFHFEVSRGDVFYKFFFKTGLSGKLFKKLMKADDRAQRLAHISPGDKFNIVLDNNHKLKKIVFQPLNANPLLITYSKDRFHFFSVNIQPTESLTYSTIVITKSLNYDGKKAGIESSVIDLMIANFSWVMDFNRDLHKGNKFVLSWNGEKTPCAIIYIGSRKTIALFAYVDKTGRKKYYDITGKTLNNTFKFAPLKYSHISSSFQKMRLHPLLNTWRSHRGTDFAAPKGRPVYAPAKGIIKHIAVLRSYGNVIYLNHGNKLTTVYAHLSKFAPGLRSSQKIKKGQLIGYVGSTGRSTGPHLHYEIRLNGIHQDAEKIQLPRQLSIPSNALGEFKNKAINMLSQLGIK